MESFVTILLRLILRVRILAIRGAVIGFGYLSYLRARLRSRTDFVVQRWPGDIEISNARKIAVFNHYDRQGVLHPFVEHYLRQIAAAGYAILFASNAPRLPEATIERLKPISTLILRRDNIGRDFGAYKDGIAAIPSLERLDSLLIANDSVYGPFHDLSEVLQRMPAEEADVWGITDSWERRYHLQSFFMLFHRPALANPGFTAFWRNLHYVQAKGWIIHRYEIGLSRALMAAGLRLKALYPYRQAAAALVEAVKDRRVLDLEGIDSLQKQFIAQIFTMVNRGIPLNPTHFFWDYLIGTMGCPFLKRELLRDNPARIPYVQYWEKVIRSVSAYDTDLIVRHLEVALKDRSV